MTTKLDRAIIRLCGYGYGQSYKRCMNRADWVSEFAYLTNKLEQIYTWIQYIE